MSSKKGKNPKQPGGKKKGKNNKKKQENPTHEKSSENPTAVRKPPRYPYLICNEENYMGEFPH